MSDDYKDYFDIYGWRPRSVFSSSTAMSAGGRGVIIEPRRPEGAPWTQYWPAYNLRRARFTPWHMTQYRNATWDSNFLRAGAVLSGGNLTVTTSTDFNGVTTATRSVIGLTTGKVYCELKWVSSDLVHTQLFGIYPEYATTTSDTPGINVGVGYRSNGEVNVEGSVVDTISTYTTGDTIGMAVDFDAQLIWFRKNTAQWNNSATADPITGVGGYDFSASVTANGLMHFAACRNEGSNDVATVNFGASNYITNPPDGYTNWPVPIFWDGTEIRTAPGENGSYEIPVGHEIDIGYAAPCLVAISFEGSGVAEDQNFFAYDPLFDVVDFFGADSNRLVDIFPEVATSQDGVTWSSWQRYQAGTYSARAFKARMVLNSLDAGVAAFVTQFVFTVYVPTRVDNWALINNVRTALNSLSLSSVASTLVYLPDNQTTAGPFNSGVSSTVRANLQVTELNWQTGDIVVLTGASLSQVTVQITNAGLGVARTVNVRPEGY